MISPQAIAAFLKRPLDDWEWLKQATRAEMDDLIAALPYRPQFHGPEPMTHQLVGLWLGAYLPQFLYIYDMGCGKSRIMLDVFSYRRLRDQAHRALVLVKNVANVANWDDEAHKFSRLRVRPLYGDSKTILATLQKTTKDELYILHYAGLQAIAAPLVAQDSNEKERRAREPDSAFIKALGRHFNFLVMDESQVAKNRQSVTFRLVNGLAKEIYYRYGLTGTPFARRPLDLWAQYYLIDRGETLGPHIGLFREAFFIPKNKFWGGTEWTLNTRLHKDFHRVIQHRSLRYTLDECLDLPESRYIQTFVPFGTTALAYYRQALEGIIRAKGATREIKNAFVVLRQVASGFVGVKDDETGAKATVIFPENPKLDALLDLIEGFPADAKVIIFHEFIVSGQLIAQRLKKAGITYVALNGQVADKVTPVRRFQTDPAVRVFVANSKSGGTGLNLQMAYHVVFYESPVSSIDRIQAEKRIRRPGQQRVTLYYDLICRKSIEEKVLQYTQEGKDLLQELLRGKVPLQSLLIEAEAA